MSEVVSNPAPAPENAPQANLDANSTAVEPPKDAPVAPVAPAPEPKPAPAPRPARVRNVWERQKGERDEDYEKFLIFRGLGPGRTILGAYRVYVANKPEDEKHGPERTTEVTRASDPFVLVSKNYLWAERAAEWDNEQQRMADDAVRERIQKFTEFEVGLVGKMYKRASELIETCEPGEVLKLAESLKGLTPIWRRAMGMNEPDIRVEQREIMQRGKPEHLALQQAVMEVARRAGLPPIDLDPKPKDKSDNGNEPKP